MLPLIINIAYIHDEYFVSLVKICNEQISLMMLKLVILTLQVLLTLQVQIVSIQMTFELVLLPLQDKLFPFL